ncbi:MAG TPA: hypothetical protein VIU46_08050 [Gallionellaceae bacterium]
MRTLTVQIQEGLAPAPEAEHAVSQLLELAREKLPAPGAETISAEKIAGDGCINLNFRTPDITGLWHAIQDKLGLAGSEKPPIANALVVVCEGEFGWDDYRLLHHFDDYETPDGL